MDITEYLKNARAEMKKLEVAAAAMLSTIDTDAVFLSVQASKLKKVKELLQALPSRTAKLENSFLTVEKTAVDITDLQNRMDDEADGLASVLSKLGDALERDSNNPPSAGDMSLSDLAGTLEEQAKRVAMALFPNAIEGLADINRMLWNFRIISADYERALKQEEARTKDRLSDNHFTTVHSTADRLTACFDNINALMNQLTISRQGDAKEVQALVDRAREALRLALKTARELDSDDFKPFRGVLEAAENLAKSINKKVDDVHVPVFPSPDNAMAALNGIIAADFYDGLAGVQRMGATLTGADVDRWDPGLLDAGGSGERHYLGVFAVDSNARERRGLTRQHRDASASRLDLDGAAPAGASSVQLTRDKDSERGDRRKSPW